MKIVGVIVEYNPLHNGHVHHIKEIKKLANPDLIIAVMSSTLTMRAELSIFDKFQKTQHALNNNIDIVIELPYSLGMHKADIFAKNAILILNMLNVSEIWIGSESNDSTIYEKCYNEFQNKDEYIKEQLNKGLSYKEITSSIFNLPSNDLLGFTYFKAIKDNSLDIKLKTIPRLGNNYLDTKINNDQFASALSIRKNINLLDQYTPSYVSINKDNILNQDKLFKFIKYKILSSTKEEIKNIFFVDEGIENKLHEIYKYNDLNSFIDYLTTKRYTSTRIRRMLMYILLNVTKNEMNIILNQNIDFVRILGFNDNGKKYINSIKKKLNIYTNIKENINLILDLELRLSKLIDLIYDLDILSKEQKAPIILKK